MSIRQIEKLPEFNAIRVTIDGSFVLGKEVQLIDDFVQEHLDEGIRKFVFNFEKVVRICSTDLGNLSIIHKSVHAKEGELIIYNPDDLTRRTLEITCFDKLVKVAKTYDDVIDYLKNNP